MTDLTTVVPENSIRQDSRGEAESAHYGEHCNVSACGGSDRALPVWMTRLRPSLLGLARVVQPATILPST
jgi:hypothetical protein